MIRAFLIAIIACALSLIGLQPAQAAASATQTHGPLANVSAATLQQWEDGISFSTERGAPRVVSPRLGVGGCGFLQNCIFFNHTDQNAILAGGGAGIAAVICIVGTPAACVVAAVIVGAALVYLQHHGICGSKKRLRIRWFPTVGGATCVT
jgi:hypothetical protein